MKRFLLPVLPVLVILACATTPKSADDESPAWGALYNAQSSRASGSNCRIGPDGAQVCGYDCKRDASGAFKCAHTPDGVCETDENGRVACYDPLYQEAPTRDGGR
ncbi:MAG: hypothetical protein ACJ790_00590 [Myxococcaceae bacterium]